MVTNYARIVDGVVVEVGSVDVPEGRELADIFHDDLQIVECPGKTKAKVGMRYAGGRYSDPDPVAQVTVPASTQIKNRLAHGLLIRCEKSPAVEGTYAVDDASRADLHALSHSASVLGTKSFDYPDMSGGRHKLTPDQLNKVSGAIAAYAVQVKSAPLGNDGMLVFPPTEVEIA